MELIQAIALLCQVSHSTALSSYSTTYEYVQQKQLECQQLYLNCVLKRNTMTKAKALETWILEK